MIGWHFKAWCCDESIASVFFVRLMAAGASFGREHFLAPLSQIVECMRVGRRFERIDILRQRVQLLIAIAPKEVGCWFRSLY